MFLVCQFLKKLDENNISTFNEEIYVRKLKKLNKFQFKWKILNYYEYVIEIVKCICILHEKDIYFFRGINLDDIFFIV